MPSSDPTESRQLLAYLAAGLSAGGVPAHEVEDDVRAVASRLGYPDAQVESAPTSVRVALGHGDPAAIESVDGGLRLDQLAEVNAIQLGLRTDQVSPQSAMARLRALRRMPHRYSTPGRYGGGVLTAVGIAMLLQPALPAVLFAAVLSPVVVALMLLAGRSRAVGTLLPLAAAFAVAVAAFAAGELGWIDGPLRTLLPPLAVLLPGGLIVTGLSELAAGAMVAGTARLMFGATQLLLFAVGVAGAILVLDPPASAYDVARIDNLGWAALPIGVVLVTLGIALMESVAVPLVPWVFGIVCLTAACQTVGVQLLGSPWSGAFLGAVAASFGSSIVEFLRPQLSRVVVFLPSFWLLVPGSLSLLSLAQLQTRPLVALDAVLFAIGVMVAIAVGVVVGASLARSLRLVARRSGMPQLLRLAARRRQSRPQP